jgi:hypothetical protein
LNSKNISSNTNDEKKGNDIHTFFKKYQDDKFNLVISLKWKKRYYEIEYMTDVHNLYNEWKNKTLYLIDNISNHYCKKNYNKIF